MNKMAWRVGAFVLAALSAQAVLAQAAGDRIPDRYIVVYKDDARDDDVDEGERKSRDRGSRPDVRFRSSIKGFAGKLSPDALRALRADARVAYIEQDMVVTTMQSSQYNATWGLDRIDQRNRPLDTVYTYTSGGAGVHAFIIDTGILPNHQDFGSRVNVAAGYTAINDGNGSKDCNGHGTHVAGTVGGSTWGVAKNVTLIPVRVLDCGGSGLTSGVIAGLDWAANSALRPAVANLSLGGGASQALDDAVARAVNRGVTVVVAAGNSNANACNYSPARAPSAITVGATTSSDARSSFSNYGSCVDVFAPGSSITSAWYTGTAATNTISGTSMASPHVAGIAALVLASNPTATPASVTSFIKSGATTNVLSSLGTGSPNLLVYSRAAGGTTEPTVQTIAVRSLSGTGQRINSSSWRATATITVRNVSTGAVVPNVTVFGDFSVGGTGKTCVTASTGSCSVTTSSMSRSSVPSTTFTVKGMSGSNMSYDAGQNLATQVIIQRP